MFRAEPGYHPPVSEERAPWGSTGGEDVPGRASTDAGLAAPYFGRVGESRTAFLAPPPQARAEAAWAPPPEAIDHPLGVARGQVAKTYIVAEAGDGLVIVDQHAAHERLVLERMRAALAGGRVASQALLIPDVVELDEPACDRLEARIEELSELGLEIERFGPRAILVRAVPALLKTGSAHGLVTDLADELRLRHRLEPEGTARPRRLHHGLPRLGPRRPAAVGRGNERLAARDGSHPA